MEPMWQCSGCTVLTPRPSTEDITEEIYILICPSCGTEIYGEDLVPEWMVTDLFWEVITRVFSPTALMDLRRYCRERMDSPPE